MEITNAGFELASESLHLGKRLLVKPLAGQMEQAVNAMAIDILKLGMTMRILDRNIEWGGVTYPLSTQVDSKLKFDVYKLNYQYSVFHDEKAELGASFGFHVMHIFAGIDASGINESHSEAATAPLPVWGLFADYNFTPRFSAYYNYQFFFINVDDKFKGGLQDFIFGLEYRLIRNVALGAAYNRFALNVDIKKDVATLHLNTNWNGGMLYGAVYF